MYKSVDFARYSSIRIGPKARVLMVEEARAMEEGVYLIGGANNLLISPTPPPLAMLSSKFDYLQEDEGALIVGAATSGGRLLTYAKTHNLAGFELLQKLPGKLGGIVKMNAGLGGFSISDNLISVTTERGELMRDEIDFAYRNAAIDGVIYEAKFAKKHGFDEAKLAKFRAMRANQPREPSAGSCFKNPPNDYAGRLLEAAGFKGKRLGGAAFSAQHANFLVNLGGATFDEAHQLIQDAQKAVLELSGVELELEIKIVGA
jgi:UDP-N-acetylmuramate dehydrogenase